MKFSFGDFVNVHIKARDNLRLGQRFCNMYMNDSNAIPDLFNQTNDELAGQAIVQWLKDNQYYPYLPN